MGWSSDQDGWYNNTPLSKIGAAFATVGSCEVLSLLEMHFGEEILSQAGLWNGDQPTSETAWTDNEKWLEGHGIHQLSIQTTDSCGEGLENFVTGISLTSDADAWLELGVGRGDSTVDPTVDHTTHDFDIYGDIVGFGGHIGGIFDSLEIFYTPYLMWESATVSIVVPNDEMLRASPFEEFVESQTFDQYGIYEWDIDYTEVSE